MMPLNKLAYTHAPPPRSGLLKGSLQLFAWLLFHPAAWRSHVQCIHPDLPPGFSIADLHPAQWRDPHIRRLFRNTLFIWMGGTAVTVALLSWLGHASTNAIEFGVTLGVFLGLMLGVFLSLTVSWLLGIVVGWIGGVGMGLGGSLLANAADGMAAHLVFGVGWGVIFGLISGTAAYTLLHLPTRRATLVSWLRQARKIMLGGAVSVLVIITMFALISIVVAREQQFGLSVSLSRYPYLGSNLGLTGVMMVIFSMILTWRTQQWRRSVLLGSLLGLSYGFILAFLQRSATIDYILFTLPTGAVVWEVTGGAAFFSFISIIMTALYAALFTLTYALLDRLAGAWAGAAAGIISATGIHLALRYLITLYRFWPNLAVSLLLIGLGTTMAYWRPWLTWPLQQAWNHLLYQFDLERTPSEPIFLHRCAAFWDEQQYLRLSGLSDHLVLAYKYHPQEVKTALAYLINSPQHWAVSRTRIELIALRLEKCATIDDLRCVQLKDGDLDTPASSILRRFGRFSRDIDASLRQVTGHHQRLALGSVLGQWEQFTHDLTLSNDAYAARFYPAALHWLDVVAGYLEELTAIVEQSQEIDNPYIFGAPISEEQTIFVGRRDIIARIEQHLLDTRRPPLLLYGQRRMGKTSLLRNLGRLFVSEIAPMFVDGQGVSLASNYVDFLYGTVRQMSRSAARYRGLTLPPLDRQALAASPFSTLDEWLDEVEALLDKTGRRVALIAFDELETLQQGMTRGRFDEADILSFFRHIIQHRPRFKVLLASSHMLAEFPPHWAGYLINMQTVKISYLDEAAAQDLVERPTPQFALRYEPDALQRILVLTRGHPHLTQLLCHELVLLKNRQAPARRRLASVADVEEAAAQALGVGRLFFEDVERNQVNENGRLLLRFIARQGENALVDTAELAAQVGEELQETLAQLQLRDLVEEDDGGYRFQVELIRRWFAA